MITIGFSTRKNNPDFIAHINKTIGLKNIEIIEVVNNGEKSLTSVYNNILNRSNNDIVVLCHDDIFFNTKSWGIKLLKHFDRSEHAILGVAGTTNLPISGRWWDDRTKMVGIVNHKQDDKEWESRYSTSLGNDIEDTVIVDGLFIGINKKRIKTKFDESFDGFHFYDLSFCFSNFLKNVKIGVIYNIRITHLSIGMTNEKWEDNREKFVEKYKSELPKKLDFNFKRKMKVMLSCLSFKNLTGSELYVYELAKGLVNLGCDVTILSQIGQPLKGMVEKFGVKCLNLEEAPGYKIGDGVWGFNGQNGFEKSKPNAYYKEKEVHFDIIHTQHKPITDLVCKLYPNIPKVATIHSEIIDLEEPIADISIFKYIAIRPSITDYIKDKINVDDDIISLIYNPIDANRYNAEKKIEGDYYLFVGTVDYLRINAIKNIIEKSKEENKKVIIIGDDYNGMLKDLTEDHVRILKPIWSDLPKYVKSSYKVVGIKLGRTTIEGWMCGKNALIYDVDEQGNILDVIEHEPPKDLFKYTAENVSNEIFNLYLKILNS